MKVCTRCQKGKPSFEYRSYTTKTGKLVELKICRDCEREHGRQHGYKTWTKANKLAEQARKKIAKQGVVYFLLAESVSLVKIGYSGGDITKRIQSIRGQSPIDLCLLGYIHGTMEDEHELHLYYGSKRHHFEWFRFDADILTFIYLQAKANNFTFVDKQLSEIKVAA